MNAFLADVIKKHMLKESNESLNDLEELSEDELNSVLSEDELFEEDNKDEKMSEEDLKIEALKIATNIAKLMSDVTPEDIIEIANKVSGFIRDHAIGSDDSSSEESSDIADDLDLSSNEESGENAEGESSEGSEE